MIDSAIDQCGIKHVITSPKVLDKFQVSLAGQLILLEDVPGQDPAGRQAGRRGRWPTWSACGLLERLLAGPRQAETSTRSPR